VAGRGGRKRGGTGGQEEAHEGGTGGQNEVQPERGHRGTLVSPYIKWSDVRMVKRMNRSQYYIRLPGKPWSPAEPHHIDGLETYLSLRRGRKATELESETEKEKPMLMSIPWSDGGHFMAYYRKKNAAVYAFQEVETNIEMDIMKCAIVLPCMVPSAILEKKE